MKELAHASEPNALCLMCFDRVFRRQCRVFIWIIVLKPELVFSSVYICYFTCWTCFAISRNEWRTLFRRRRKHLFTIFFRWTICNKGNTSSSFLLVLFSQSAEYYVKNRQIIMYPWWFFFKVFHIWQELH